MNRRTLPLAILTMTMVGVCAVQCSFLFAVLGASDDLAQGIAPAAAGPDVNYEQHDAEVPVAGHDVDRVPRLLSCSSPGLFEGEWWQVVNDSYANGTEPLEGQVLSSQIRVPVSGTTDKVVLRLGRRFVTLTWDEAKSCRIDPVEAAVVTGTVNFPSDDSLEGITAVQGCGAQESPDLDGTFRLEVYPHPCALVVRRSNGIARAYGETVEVHLDAGGTINVVLEAPELPEFVGLTPEMQRDVENAKRLVRVMHAFEAVRDVFSTLFPDE